MHECQMHLVADGPVVDLLPDRLKAFQIPRWLRDEEPDPGRDWPSVVEGVLDLVPASQKAFDLALGRRPLYAPFAVGQAPTPLDEAHVPRAGADAFPEVPPRRLGRVGRAATASPRVGLLVGQTHRA